MKPAIDNAFAAGGVFDEPLRRILGMLGAPNMSHLILAVADDDVVRQEATAQIGERLSGRYRFAEFDYADAPLPSLMRFYRRLSADYGGPVCLFAHGLEVLKVRGGEAYEKALHFLNAHREDLTRAHGAVFLWLTTDTWEDVLEQAPDFADWESVGVTFALPAGRRLERTALGRLSVRDAEDQRRQVERFREMLARPNLGAALEAEFTEQLDLAERRLGRVPDVCRDYRQQLVDELHEHVLGGFAPQVGGRVLSLPLSKLFLPLRAVEGRPALAEYAEDDLRRQQQRAGDPNELDWRTRSEDLEKRHARLRHRQAVQRSFTMEELLKERRAVLLGDPGSGKTTITRYLAWALAADDYRVVGEAVRGRLPVLVRLANYGKALEADGELTLLDYLGSQLMPRAAFGPMLRAAVEAGECLVILDGLDEVTDPGLRGDVALRIQALISRHAGNRYLITSRIVGYDRTPLTRDYQHATLQELGDEDKRRFVGLWYAAISAEIHDRNLAAREAELAEALEKRPQIARMGANPLLLTIMVLMHWRGFKLPSRRVQVYQNATDTLIEFWTAERATLDAEEVKQLLAPVAFYILSSNVGGVIARRDLLPRLRDGIVAQRGCDEEEAASVCRDLVTMLSEQSGIFLERGLDAEGRPVYGFLHQTFAEYLAALHLSNLFLDGSFKLGKYIHRSAWQEPLLLLAGHLSLFSQMHATRLVRGILDHPCHYEHILHRNVLLAAECLADDIQVAPKVRDEVLRKLAEVLLDGASKPREAATELYRPIGRSRHRVAAVAAVRVVVASWKKPDQLTWKDHGPALALSTAFVRLEERAGAIRFLKAIERRSPDSLFRLQLEGWPDDAESLLLRRQKERWFSVQAGSDLKSSYLVSISAHELQQLLGSDRFSALIERLHAEGKEEGQNTALHWLRALASEDPPTDSFLELARQEQDPHVRLLAATHLLETERRAVGIEILEDMAAGGYTEAAEVLLEAGEEDLIAWDVVRDVAFQPHSDNAPQAIRLLLKASKLDVALPAAFRLLFHDSAYAASAPYGHRGYSPIIEEIRSTKHTHLTHLLASWLALWPGYRHRLEACGFLADSGRIEEAIPLLRILAYECHGETSQKACRRLLMLREVESVIPVLRHHMETSDLDLRYEAALALTLVPHSSKPHIDLSRARLKVSILEERHHLFRQANAALYEGGLALLRQVASTDSRSVTSLGRLSLAWLCGFDSFRESLESLVRRRNPPFVDRNLIFFDLIGDKSQRARERWTRSAEGRGAKPSRMTSHWAAEVTNIVYGIDAPGVLDRYLRGRDELLRTAANHALASRLPKGSSLVLNQAIDDFGPGWNKPIFTLALVAPLDVLEPLTRRYEHDDAWFRDGAIRALVRSRTPAAIPIIMRALEDRDASVRRTAVAGLSLLEIPDAVKSPGNLLEDPASNVRRAAVRTLGRIAGKVALGAATGALEDEDAGVRSAAVGVIARLPCANRAELLRKALEDASPAVRRSAIWSLRIDETITLEDLFANLTDTDSGVRAAVAKCMGDFVEGLTPLLDLLGDEDGQVRAAACAALGRQKSAPTAPLIALLNDPYEGARSAAASALGRLGEVGAAEYLQLALRDPGAGVRGSAAIALARLGCRDAIGQMTIAAADVLLNFGNQHGTDRIASALARLNATKALPMLVTCAIPSRQYLGALLPLDPQSILDAFDRFEFPLEFYGWPHWLRGQALWRLEGQESAESALVEAACKHETIEHLLTLALLRLEQNNLDDAGAHVERALAKYWETEQERALCFLTRALVTRRRGDLVRALADVREAVRLDSHVTDLQDLEFDHLWRPSALEIVEELVPYVEHDQDDYSLSEVAEPASRYRADL